MISITRYSLRSQRNYIKTCSAFQLSRNSSECKEKVLYALIRIDTHGRKDVVKENMVLDESKKLEVHYDSLGHHQGYFTIEQHTLKKELTTK